MQNMQSMNFDASHEKRKEKEKHLLIFFLTYLPSNSITKPGSSILSSGSHVLYLKQEREDNEIWIEIFISWL